MLYDYSYDIHGNVKTLVQEIHSTLNTQTSTLLKSLDYDYDLISGKVNYAYYQKEQADQLVHKYTYDGDNRITEVYTSANGKDWTKEAKYDYYAHGPLAMSKLGNSGDIEQCSYVYTLQGWIKGVKGQNFSYALGYNGNDYKAVGSDVTGGVLSTPVATGTDLYNGNISTWTSLNPKINTTSWTQQFTYDQLNRIKSGTTLNGGNNYKNTYSYDANGNILTLSRWDKSGAQIDQFGYNYESKGAGYLGNTNKLRSVDDGINTTVGSALSSEDLEDQNIDNYQYDDIGNLSKDDQESIAKIEWTVYGKVKSVNRVSDPVTKLPLGDKPNLVFEYDASGNRTCKISIDKAGGFTKTFYLRDASGNVMSTYTITGTSSLIALQEQYLYGSGRLGVLEKGARSYELTDHLGNVRSVVDESKSVSSATDYYPFGMTANSYSPSGYRYGFSGKEKDDEVKGIGNSIDYGARIYDTRLGRWTSLDPLMDEYPSMSPYCYAANMPIVATDPDGKAVIIKTTTTSYDGIAPTKIGEIAVTNGSYSLTFNTVTKEWDLIVNNHIQYSSAFKKPGANGKTLEQENPGLLQSSQIHEGVHVKRNIKAANSSISYTTNLLDGGPKTFRGTADKVMTQIFNAYITQRGLEREKLVKDQVATLEAKYNPLMAAANGDPTKIAEINAQAQTEYNAWAETALKEFDTKTSNNIQTLATKIMDKVNAKSASLNVHEGETGVNQEASKAMPAGSNAQKYQDGKLPIKSQGKTLAN